MGSPDQQPLRSWVAQVVALLFVVLPACIGWGQTPEPFRSREVHADGSITFRYRDSGAHQVQVSVATIKAPIAMTKTDGVWTATTPPMPAETYWYWFIVDGRPQLDPVNGLVLPNYIYLDSNVVVPGPAPQLWEATDVPHGELHHHFYKSEYTKGEPGEHREDYVYDAPGFGIATGYRDYYVYTPPGYDPRRNELYPVLYLLHGFAQTAADWTQPGGANFILDNLIEQGTAKPMIVVMPLCYGYAVGDCSNAVLSEIMPAVESEYRVQRDRDHRAIAGLSLGAVEALSMAFQHPELFGWVGSFSAGDTQQGPHALSVESPDKTNFRLLWIGCGTEDALLAKNQELVTRLKAKHYDPTVVLRPGGHTWMVWHDDLIHFAPLLFQDK